MTTKRPTTLQRTVIRPTCTGAGSWANKETLFALVPIRGDIETGRRQTVLALSNENRHKHTSTQATHSPSTPALPCPSPACARRMRRSLRLQSSINLVRFAVLCCSIHPSLASEKYIQTNRIAEKCRSRGGRVESKRVGIHQVPFCNNK